MPPSQPLPPPPPPPPPQLLLLLLLLLRLLLLRLLLVLLFFFFCVRCGDRAKASGRWLLGSPQSAVVRQLAPRTWCPLQCLLVKTVGLLSQGVSRSDESVQEFVPQSYIHIGLNQQDPVSSDVFLAHSDQYAARR